MDAQVTTASDASQLAFIQYKLTLEDRIQRGANWFFWIAALSLANSISSWARLTLTLPLGLGATQFVDASMAALAKDPSQNGTIARAASIVMDVGIAGIFALFGVLGRKRYRWAIITGMLLYAIDAVILTIMSQDQNTLGLVFHIFGLSGIWRGLKSINQLAKLEDAAGKESIEAVMQRMPPLERQSNPEQRRFRWIIVGLLLLVLACLFAYFVIPR